MYLERAIVINATATNANCCVWAIGLAINSWRLWGLTDAGQGERTFSEWFITYSRIPGPLATLT